MAAEFTDEMLGAYVDEELDPAQMSWIAAAAQESPELKRRVEAIRCVTGAVRMLCRARPVRGSRPPRCH
jgi:anti-sigma factor RsiW